MTSKGNLLGTGTNNPKEVKERIKPNNIATRIPKKDKRAEVAANIGVTRSTHNDIKVLKTILKSDTFDDLIIDLIRTKVNSLDEEQQELFKLLTKMNKD